MSPKRQRLYFICFSVVCFSAAVLLVVNALEDKVVYFYSPTDLKTKHINPQETIRIGGLVKIGSVQAESSGGIQFVVTDNQESLTVYYSGILPNLFREGQGVVAEGHILEDVSFSAKTILAKHDENYMPPEVADKLKQKSEWHPETSIVEPAP